MNIEDIRSEFPHLMTPEELEDSEYEGPRITPRWLLEYCSDLGVADEFDRKDFEANRRPGMGLTLKQLKKIEQASAKGTPVQKRKFFQYFRGQMQRQLISTCDAATTEALCQIMRDQIEAGEAAPIPSWWKYSTVRFGPRKLKLAQCAARGCLQSEHPDRPPFKRCSKCRLASYCSRECQIKEWKTRHKTVCKAASQQRGSTKDVGKLLTQLLNGSGGPEGLEGLGHLLTKK